MSDSSAADSVLTTAAFGGRPGLHPLPAATGPEQRWLRAVALGGQGFYSGARAELARLQRENPTGAPASFAASTEASLLRQLGWHRQAAAYDGHAFVLARASSARSPEDAGLLAEAQCDALTGLAADALGCGRLDLSRRLLAQCADLLPAVQAADDAGAPGMATFWRQRIRLHWVTAETALASGDFATAQHHAARASAEADRSPSVRHRVKSDLLRAASLTGADDLGPARALAVDVLDRCAEHGLVPLRWAAAMLAAGIGAVSDAGRVRDDCAATVTVRGGRFATIRN